MSESANGHGWREIQIRCSLAVVAMLLSTNAEAQWIDALFWFGYRCLACGNHDAKLCIDHVVPLSRGGTNEISNIQPLCRSCNSKKHAKHIDYRTGADVEWLNTL